MYESLIGKRHVLCVLSVFLLCAFFTGKEVFANERTIEISIAERNNENWIIIDGNELGGSIPLLPGCEVRTGIRIQNATKDDLYIRWECLADKSDTELYRYLQLRLYDEKGNMAYEGTVGDLSFISGPRPGRSTGTWTAVLFVPPEADNAIAGDELEFDLVLSFSDNPAFKDGEDPVFVPDIKETGGMGHRYYASVQMTGPADFASGKAQKDENGYPLITSGFCRDGIGAPRSGYAFDRDYTGGGSWNVYAAPMEILLHGIDSGEWVLVDQEKHHWKYRMPDGSYLKGGFALVRNPYSIRAGTYRWYCLERAALWQPDGSAQTVTSGITPMRSRMGSSEPWRSDGSRIPKTEHCTILVSRPRLCCQAGSVSGRMTELISTATLPGRKILIGATGSTAPRSDGGSMTALVTAATDPCTKTK